MASNESEPKPMRQKERTLVMKGPVVVWSDTEERHMFSTSDLGILDELEGIGKRREATIPRRLAALQTKKP